MPSGLENALTHLLATLSTRHVHHTLLLYQTCRLSQLPFHQNCNTVSATVLLSLSLPTLSAGHLCRPNVNEAKSREKAKLQERVGKASSRRASHSFQVMLRKLFHAKINETRVHQVTFLIIITCFRKVASKVASQSIKMRNQLLADNNVDSYHTLSRRLSRFLLSPPFPLSTNKYPPAFHQSYQLELFF